MPPASPAFRCYYVGICYIVCLPPLYKRGLGYKCPTRTRLHILCKHDTTTSPTITYLVHYIRHNSNKVHLGEYSPPPWIHPCVEPPCTLDFRYVMSTSATPRLHVTPPATVVPSRLLHSQHLSKIKFLFTLVYAPNF